MPLLAFAALLALPAAAHGAFGLTALHWGSLSGYEDYAYTKGATVVARGTVDADRNYRFVVTDPAGTVRYTSLCQYEAVGGEVSASRTHGAGDPLSGATAWQFRLEQFPPGDSLCQGAPELTAAKYFTVASITTYLDAALTTPTSYFEPGDTVHLRAAGLGVAGTTSAVAPGNGWDVYWITPSGGLGCQNTGGNDRPDSASSGAFPPTAGSFLQYRPNVTNTGDTWNRESRYDFAPCVALTSAQTGTWGLWLVLDNTHFVALPAFTLGIPPAPTITSSPPSPGAATSPSWSFTGAGASSFQCRLERPDATALYDWAACTSPRSYSLAGQPDGDYTFRVRGLTGGGTPGPDASSVYTLDATAPAAPTITSGPAADSADATPSYAFTGEAGAAFSCRMERGVTVVSDWAACTSPAGFDFGSQPDGSYTFSVRATDAVGNTGPASTHTYALDRTDPVAPTLDAVPPAVVTTDTAQWSFSGGEAGGHYECRLEQGGTAVFDWGTCASPHDYDLTALAEGAYDFRVRAVDAAGNASTSAADGFTLDRTGPGEPIITARPADASADETPAWSFTGDPGVTFQCRIVRGGVTVSDWIACTSPFGLDLQAEPDGDYVFAVRAFDGGGNPGQSATDAFTLDRAAPAAPTITASPGVAGNDTTPAWSFAGEAGASFECRLDRPDATPVSDWTGCTAPAGFDLGGEADGAYTFRVVAIDAAGNRGTEATDTYLLDTTGPAAPTIGSGPPAVSSDPMAVWSFGGEPGAGFECRLARGATTVSAWTACTSPAGFDLAPQADGVYTFSVRAVDASSNAGPVTTASFELDRAVPGPPAITSGPAAASNDGAPQYAFTVEAGSAGECRLERGPTVVSDWAPCAGPRQFDLSLEPDGAYLFRVRAVDGAQNTSSDVSWAHVLDRAAPAAPVLTSQPPAVSTDDTPEVGFTGEPGASFACRLERGATVVSDWAGCTSVAGFDLTSQPDGSYVFRVRASDAAGNASSATVAPFALDRSVPAAPAIDARPGDDGNDRSPAWAFSTAEAGATLECRLARGATVVADWAACASPRTFDLLLEPDGAYAFAVRAVNGLGTAGPATTDTYRLDTAAPAAPVITGGPPAQSNDPAPAWSFTGEPGAAFECRMERGAAVVAAWAPCSTPHSTSLAAEPDGTYTFRVRQTDAAGNTGPDASRAYDLDRTLPPAPTIDSAPSSPGADRTPEWTISGTAGMTLECRLTRGATVVSDWAACAAPAGFDLAGQADGTYTLHARQVNALGTRGPAVTSDYTLDATAPPAPAITGSPGAAGNGSSPSWSFAAEAGAAVECRLVRGSTVVDGWTACASPRAYALGGEPDGEYTFSVRATDAVGNAGPAASSAYRLDRVPPAPPAVVDGPGPLGRNRTPAWSFTAEEGAAFECTLERSGAPLEGWAPCDSPRGFDLAALEDGPVTFGVRARDAAGNVSLPSGSEYVLDTTPGGVTIDAGPAPLGRDRAPAWSFSGEPGAAFACRLTLGTLAIADWAACASPQRFDLTGRPDGTFSFALTAADPAGNTGPEARADYVLDTTAPAAPRIEARPDSPGRDRTPSWRFSGETGATFSCRVDASGASGAWALCASPFTADLARSGDGHYRFFVRATDAAGNTGGPAADGYDLATAAAPDPGGPGGDGKGGGDDGGGGDQPAPLPTDPGRPAGGAPDAGSGAAPPPAGKDQPRDPRHQARRDDAAQPQRDTARGTDARDARGTPPRPEAGGKDEPRNIAQKALDEAVKAIVDNPDKSVFPFSLILIVLAFLGIQNRIDRSDPKLALAPAFRDPALEFNPSPGD
ncbi:MAG TPA: hypothetical protein VF529_00720 [Solirubrobacteraceae bacterium]